MQRRGRRTLSGRDAKKRPKFQAAAESDRGEAADGPRPDHPMGNHDGRAATHVAPMDEQTVFKVVPPIYLIGNFATLLGRARLQLVELDNLASGK